ncbi:MAG: hypothetical protein GY826_19260, partial [Fuerstiella sp.]|nr:hypothetical protein [Fuerstiella sp.]
MQLLQTNDTNFDRAAIVCRQSVVKNMIASVICVLVFGGLPMACWHFRGPTPDFIACTLIAVLVAVVTLSRAKSLLRPGNWSMVIQHNCVWINLRSLYNHRFAEAKTVLNLSYSDIVSAQIRTAWVSASMSGDATAKQKSLELKLSNLVDTTDLGQAITEEVRRRAPERIFMGITSTGRVNHSSVNLIDDRTLRIHWTGPNNCMSPGVDDVIELLSREIQVLKSVQQQGRN